MGALIFLLVRGLELLRCMITPGPQQLGSASRAQTDAFYIEPNIFESGCIVSILVHAHWRPSRNLKASSGPTRPEQNGELASSLGHAGPEPYSNLASFLGLSGPEQ